MVTHHVLDALAVLPHLPQRAGLRVLDVGSGGGVPGIPLAIARPDWHVVMLDSNHKKGAFVQQAMIELALANAESVDRPGRGLRAVGAVRRGHLARFRRPRDLRRQPSARHLAPGGQLIAMKGVLPGRGGRQPARRHSGGRRAGARRARRRGGGAT